MHMNKLATLMACPLILMLAACGPTPTTTVKETPKPIEPVTGQSALYKMYQVARSAWSADAQVLTCTSVHLPEVPQAPGKAGAWQAAFTSERLGRKRPYSYSVVESTDVHKDVFAGQEESWSGKQGVESSFTIQAVSVDTAGRGKQLHDSGGIGRYHRGVQDGARAGRGLRQEKPRDEHRIRAGKDQQVSGPGVARGVGRIGGDVELFD